MANGALGTVRHGREGSVTSKILAKAAPASEDPSSVTD